MSLYVIKMVLSSEEDGSTHIHQPFTADSDLSASRDALRFAASVHDNYQCEVKYFGVYSCEPGPIDADGACDTSYERCVYSTSEPSDNVIADLPDWITSY